MFKLRWGYVVSGCITGLVLLFLFIVTFPDGNLHITFCDVGQGDAVYILFPDGRDMLVDGGPNNAVLECLGNHMPFWDRRIDMVVLTHPEKDHVQGLIEVLARYNVGYVLRSQVANTSDGYQALEAVRVQKKIPLKFLTAGDHVRVGSTTLSFVWPSKAKIAEAARSSEVAKLRGYDNVLGVQATPDNLNEYSLVFFLRYGAFDAFFTGDADIQVESGYRGTKLADGRVEVLKVPHHGSKTGFTDAFISWLRPAMSVISVGKNNYGHPAPEVLEKLEKGKSQTVRTDQAGDIETVSDGVRWWRLK